MVCILENRQSQWQPSKQITDKACTEDSGAKYLSCLGEKIEQKTMYAYGGRKRGEPTSYKARKEIEPEPERSYYPKETLNTLELNALMTTHLGLKYHSWPSTTNGNHTHKRRKETSGVKREEGRWFITCSSCLALATCSASSSANFSSDIYSLNIISLSACLTDLYLGSFLRLSFTYQNQELWTSVYFSKRKWSKKIAVNNLYKGFRGQSSPNFYMHLARW